MERMNWVLGEEIDVALRVLVRSCHKIWLGVGVAAVVLPHIENYFLLPLLLFLELWSFRIQTGTDLIKENLSRLLFLLLFDLKKDSPGVALNGVYKCQTWKSTLKWCFLPISLKRNWDWLKYSSSFHITSEKTYLSAAESAWDWEAKVPTGDDRWCEKLSSLCSFLGLSSTLNKLTKLWSGPTLSTRC